MSNSKIGVLFLNRCCYLHAERKRVIFLFLKNELLTVRQNGDYDDYYDDYYHLHNLQKVNDDHDGNSCGCSYERISS